MNIAPQNRHVLESAEEAVARAGERLPWIAFAFMTAGALVIGLVTRAWHADRPLWFDELFSVVMASPPFAAISEFQSTHDIHPPLYSLLLHAWSALVAPASDLWLRTLSIVLTFGTVAALVGVAWRWRGASMARLVLPLALVSPILTVVAQQVRHYALLSCLTALVLVPLVPIVQGRGRVRDYVLLALACASCFYVQFIGGFYVGVVLALAFLLAPDRRARFRLILVGVAVAVAFAPWLPSLFVQMQMEQALHGGLPGVSRSLGSLVVDLAALWLGSAGASARPLGLLYALTLVAACGWTARRWLRQRPDRVEALFVLLWAAGPALYMVLALALGLRVTAVTYLLAFGQLSSLLLAVALTDLRQPVRTGAALACVVLLAAASWDKGVIGQRTERWDQAAQCYATRVAENDAVLFTNGITKHMLGRYAPAALGAHANPEEYVYARNDRQGVAIEPLRQHIADRDIVWVLTAYTELGSAVHAALQPAYVAAEPIVCGPVEFVRFSRR